MAEVLSDTDFAVAILMQKRNGDLRLVCATVYDMANEDAAMGHAIRLAADTYPEATVYGVPVLARLRATTPQSAPAQTT